MTDPLAVSITEAARLLGCGRSKFYALIKANEISVVKLGRRSLIPMAALRSFVSDKTEKAA